MDPATVLGILMTIRRACEAGEVLMRDDASPAEVAAAKANLDASKQRLDNAFAEAEANIAARG